MEKNKKKGISKAGLITVGSVLICVAVVILLLFLMRGETIVTGEYDGVNVREKVICVSDNVVYPLFKYDDSNKKSMEVTATFRDDQLDTITLIYKLYYDNAETIKRSATVNHAALDTLSQEDGFGPNAFGANYGRLKDALQLSLYGRKEDLTGKGLKYFMLDGLKSVPYTQEKITRLYNEQGLNCEIQN